MYIHTFGDPRKPAIILVHGVFTPWQIWQDAIEHFQQDCFVVVPALDGHTTEAPSTFLSVEEEASRIEDYIRTHLGGHVCALCGLSMGGAVCWELFRRNTCRIDHLILDGAPLTPMPGWLVRGMARQYQEILRKAKLRDARVLRNFSRSFLPGRYLDEFLRFADTMEPISAANMLTSIGAGRLMDGGSPDTGILYLYGTRLNECISKRSVKVLKARYPHTAVRCFPGYAHAELAIYHPADWIASVRAQMDPGSSRPSDVRL